MAYSQAQKEATLNYRREKLVRITLDMTPEKKQLIQDAASAAGLSVRRYLLDLVEKDCKMQNNA